MKSSKFVIHYYLLFLSLLLMAMPFYHQATGREMQAALKINLDTVAGITGMLGFATFVAIVNLKRRIEALEKLGLGKNQQS
ncbi:MAG TPA: hypothetical protein VJN89_10950 [Candidatus Acidoferrum sp.]|nr:hypothetical protein [Candidatus Acidoferrum sp.]